ncbi:MAG: arginine deiminase-related protein [Candidatus Dormibacteraeota bacterium]|nr:arginine deiminase-related protein [Candidatus Dormibacteraeota bacterium]
MAILMCRPEFFGVEYEINPWMNIAVEVDHDRAVEQWEALESVYASMGETIELVAPVSGLPDMVFSANAAVLLGKKAVLSRFRHPQRTGEETYWRVVLERLGFTVQEVSPNLSFEGAGDALFVGDHLFQAWGFRTDEATHTEVAALLDVESTSVHLVDPRFYHLDTCFCPLDDRTALVAPQAFAPASLDAIRRRVPRLIEVPEAVAEGFGCNALPRGDTVVSSTAIEGVREPLAGAGFRLVALPMTEFMKAGGGVRCLSLPLSIGAAA